VIAWRRLFWAEVDAAENVLRAVLGATGGIAGDR
jgi:hypothetical protein